MKINHVHLPGVVRTIHPLSPVNLARERKVKGLSVTRYGTKNSYGYESRRSCKPLASHKENQDPSTLSKLSWSQKVTPSDICLKLHLVAGIGNFPVLDAAPTQL